MRPVILVIDDDELNLKVVDEVLSDAGYEVVLVADGAAGLDALEHVPHVKVVLLDWMMPPPDGLEVLRQIRARSIHHDKVVMMLTAVDTKEKVIQALQEGADDFIMKPFEPERLIEKVRNGLMLGRRKKK